MKLNIKIIILCLILTPSLSHAGTVKANISRLSTASEQWTNVTLVNESIDISAHPCATNTNNLSWNKSTEHGKQMFSLALAGLMAGKKLYFYYSNSECGLWNTQALVTRIDIYDE